MTMEMMSHDENDSLQQRNIAGKPLKMKDIVENLTEETIERETYIEAHLDWELMINSDTNICIR